LKSNGIGLVEAVDGLQTALGREVSKDFFKAFNDFMLIKPI
jgi:hypothetical protein